MLEKDRVFTLFRLFSDYDDDTAYSLRGMCDFSADRLAARLRLGLDPTSSPAAMERLCAAAAVDAFCNSILLRLAVEDQDEVKVGDITLRKAAGNLVRESEELRERFMADIADLLEAPFVLGQAPS